MCAGTLANLSPWSGYTYNFSVDSEKIPTSRIHIKYSLWAPKSLLGRNKSVPLGQNRPINLAGEGLGLFVDSESIGLDLVVINLKVCALGPEQTYKSGGAKVWV